MTHDTESRPSRDYARLAMIVMALLAVLYTLHLAKEVLLPITLALIFALLFAPLVKRLQSYRIPRALSAVVVISAGVAVLGSGLYFLSSSALDWLQRLPEATEAVREHMLSVQSEVAEVDTATRNIEAITDEVTVATEAEGDTEAVVITDPGWRTELWYGIRNFAVYSALSVILLFFLLTGGEQLMRRYIETLPSRQDRQRVVNAAQQAQAKMSRYLITITVVNSMVGLITGLALWLMDFPDPALWGTMAAALRFVPYLGVSITAALLALVGTVNYDSTWLIISTPLGYLVFTAFVGQVVDPLVHGFRFRLNPVVVFIWIFFWGWLWGAPGVLLAVPLLTLFQVVCQHSERLSGIAHMIGDESEPESY